MCMTIDSVVTHWKKQPEGTIKDYYYSGSFPWGGLFYLFCHGEWLARSREKAVGFAACIVHVPQAPSGKACLMDWQTCVRSCARFVVVCIPLCWQHSNDVVLLYVYPLKQEVTKILKQALQLIFSCLKRDGFFPLQYQYLTITNSLCFNYKNKTLPADMYVGCCYIVKIFCLCCSITKAKLVTQICLY